MNQPSALLLLSQPYQHLSLISQHIAYVLLEPLAEHLKLEPLMAILDKDTLLTIVKLPEDNKNLKSKFDLL